jgi:ketosteroid isomerase-like protein
VSDSTTEQTLETITRFNEAFNAHDVDGVMALMTDDVVFENTSPAPDGERFTGQEAVRAFWTSFFTGSPHAHFDAEDVFAAGDRATVRWRYSWGDGHVRGVDVFAVRDGKVSQKLSYVKG